VTTAISVKKYKNFVLRVERNVKEVLPWSEDFASHETVNFHNFHMAQRWDHSAYYPPVIFPCLQESFRGKKGKR
jgi:hypothetical protein